MKEWQSRPLEPVYPFVWLDCMHYKVKDEGKVDPSANPGMRSVARAVYNILALTREGRKDLIGMYVSESEGARLWLQVLTDLKNRGLQDILIACIDNLKGFAGPADQIVHLRSAISSVFPQTQVQSCVIHCPKINNVKVRSVIP